MPLCLQMAVGKIVYPVSLLSAVIKIFEKLVSSSFLDVLEKRGLFSDFQCGNLLLLLPC